MESVTSENITNEFLAFNQSQWTSNGSNIYLNSSVGIGTSLPRANLDVYGSINALSANFGTVYTGGTSFTSLNVSGESNLLGNVVIQGNLSLTGNLINVTSNTQISNSLVINNAGTSTALKVHQLEAVPVHYNNVAEFWDYQTLALLINGDGNVGIHTTVINPHAFAVSGSSNLEYIKTINVYSSNAVSASNLYGNVVGSNTVSASTIYGTLAGSNTITGSSVSATTLYGTLAGANTVSSSGLYGPVVGSNTVAASTIYGTLAGANTITGSSVSATTLYGQLAGANTVTGSSVSATTLYGTLAGSNTVSASGLYGPVVGSNTVAASTIYGTLAGSNAITASTVSATTYYGTLAGANTIAGSSMTLTTALDPSYGGTGISSYTVGDIIYASGTTTLSKLADVATGSALISGGVGVTPSWGKVGLTTHVSGTLPVANGGTGITSFTNSGVLYASSTSTLTTGSILTFDGTTLVNSAIGVNGGVSAKRFYASAVGDNTDTPGVTPADNAGGPWYGLGYSVDTGLTSYVQLAGWAGLSLKTGSGSFVINGSGNVGIGTTNPGYLLDVNGSSRISAGTLTVPTILGTTTVGINTTVSPGTTPLRVFWNSSTNTTGWCMSIGDTTGYNNGNSNPVLFTILYNAVATGNGVVQQFGKSGTNSLFWSYQYNSGGTDKMGFTWYGVSPYTQFCMLANGNVGIGTSTPAYKHHVYNADSSYSYYGPNSSWSSYLVTGAGTSVIGSSAGVGQVISTNGNIHIDGGSDGTTKREIYLQYYQNNGGTATGTIRSYGTFSHTGNHSISGIPYTPGRPMSMVGKNNGDTATNNTMIFNSVAYNVGSMYSTTTGRWTASIAGYYIFTYSGLGGNNQLYPNMRWWKNGGDFGWGASHDNQGNGYQNIHSQEACTVMIYLAVNDYVEFRVVDGSFYGQSTIHSTACCFFIG